MKCRKKRRVTFSFQAKHVDRLGSGTPHHLSHLGARKEQDSEGVHTLTLPRVSAARNANGTLPAGRAEGAPLELKIRARS